MCQQDMETDAVCAIPFPAEQQPQTQHTIAASASRQRFQLAILDPSSPAISRYPGPWRLLTK